MKRSRYVALLAMGASALALTACGESETPAGIYTSVEQCVADKQFSQAECDKAFATAKEEHKKVAPKYANKTECEADFGVGKCEESPYKTTSGTSTFMPLIMGYMLGRALSGPGFTPQPLYRGAGDNNFRTGDNRSVGSRTGMQSVPSSATSSAFKSTTTTRGGFGRNAGIYGSSSSSSRSTSSSGS